MRRAVLAGAIIFVGIIIVRAPAGLLPLFVNERGPLNLIEVAGTLWRGNAGLLVAGNQVGRLSWSINPATFLRGALGYDLNLINLDSDLNVKLIADISSQQLILAGTIGADSVNEWLAPYRIVLSGEFQLSEVTVSVIDGLVQNSDGELNWSGGPVSYVLSGDHHAATLPAIRALLGPGAAATAFAAGSTTPILQVELLANGFAKVGVTKYLTKILGDPWPGGDPDHAVVLEVEEQVF